MAKEIEVQYSVSYVHTQNGLTQSLIKRIKLIASPLLQGCNLPTSCWSHAVLHATGLVQLHIIPALHLNLYVEINQVPSICEKFGCDIYTSISPPK
jgi:hypothetical protein